MDRQLSRSAAGLVALALVVGGLVSFALRTPEPPDETVAASPSTGEPASPSPSATRPPSASAPATAAPTPEALSESVLLSLTSRTGAAVRGLAGDCESGGAVLELSKDGGATWSEVRVPARALLRVKAVSDNEAWVVGADRSCNARFISTTNGGRTWRTKTGTAGAWHLLPAGASQLHAPATTVDSPCEQAAAPIDLASTNDSEAAVLCPGGRVYTTRTSGGTWKRAGAVSDAVALAFSDPSTGFAAAPGGESCDGTTVSRTTDRGVTWQEQGCVEGASNGVALSFSGRSVGLLATADETWRTKDAGKTWTRL